MIKILLLFLIPLITSQLLFDVEKILLSPLFYIYGLVTISVFFLVKKELPHMNYKYQETNSIKTEKKPYSFDFSSVILFIPIYIFYISLPYTIPIRGDALYHSSSMKHFLGIFLQTIRGVNMLYLSLSLLILLYIYMTKNKIPSKLNLLFWSLIIVNLIVLIYLSIDVDLGRYRYPQQLFFVGSIVHTFFSDLLLENIGTQSTYYFQLLKLTNLFIFLSFFISIKKLGRKNPLSYTLPAFFLVSNKVFLYYLNSTYLDISSLLLVMLSIFYLSSSENFRFEYYYLILSFSSMFKEYGLIAIAVSSLVFVMFKLEKAKTISFYALLSSFPSLVLYLNQSLFTVEYSRQFIFLSPDILFFKEYLSNFYFLGSTTTILVLASLAFLISKYKVEVSLKIAVLFSFVCLLLISIDQTNSSYPGYSRFYLPLYVLIFTFLLEIGKKLEVKNYSLVNNLILVLLMPLVLYSYPKIQTEFNFIEYKDSPIYLPSYSNKSKPLSDESLSEWRNMLKSGEAYSMHCLEEGGKDIFITIKKINYLNKYPNMKNYYIEDIVRDGGYISCKLDKEGINELEAVLYLDNNLLISTKSK